MSEQDQDQSSGAVEGSAEAAEDKAPPPPKDPWLEDPVDPEWADEDDDPLVRALRAAHPEAVVSARSYAGELSLVLTREGAVGVARSLHDEHGFHYMVDVAGADYPDREERFEAVYHVYNHATETRLRFKVPGSETQPVPSMCGVWAGCNWPEREAYDMYGLRFEGHPDMTRILLWEGFNGFPLRKEFPVEGIDTGAAIYPEYYNPQQGPIGGTGTGWKVPEPPKPEPPPEEPASTEEAAGGAAPEESGDG